ncbi:hypothetical protein KRP22_012141 [Phytophthora ramorum]|nr:hypothetical protein KRP22_14844 [Phytophthora ramorum]
MSCSLIEAKFQVLDRTTRMLSKSKSLRTPKVASSEQLRDLVETQKPTSLLPTLNAVKGVVVTRNNQTYLTGEKTSRSQPSTAREEKSEKRSGHSPPRPSTGRRDPYESSTELLPDKWVDPKQRRAEQLLQETWHEIESAVNWGQELGSPTREALRSKLLNESVQDDRQEQESISSQRQILEQYMDNQINGDSGGRRKLFAIDGPQTVRDAVSSRYFNPFLYFPGLNRPSDLYGHVLRIIVTSLQPVTRIVINTSVQFTRFPDEAVVEPPVDPVRTNAADAAKQEANLLRVLTRRNNSASSASRRRKQISKPRPKEPRTALKSNNEDSTASLAMDQCNPWSSSGQEDFNSDASSGLLEQMLPLHLDEPRPPSPPASPRKGPTTDHLNQSPMTTIDKKKMQLQRLRANIRREMREEDNCNM